MSSDDDTVEQRLEDIVREVAERVSQTYRLSPDKSAEMVAPVLRASRELREALASNASLKRIRRMRAYKDAVREARRSVYFGLRRYRRDEEALLEAVEQLESLDPHTEADTAQEANGNILRGHVSTAERIGHEGTALAAIMAAIDTSETVVDAGAGVFPLMIPFDRLPGLRRYVCLDRDPIAMRAVRAFGAWRGDDRLCAVEWKVESGWGQAMEAGGVERFDVALMLKLVPVIKRQAPELLAVLAAAPAGRLVISGSRQALTKRRSIAHRELAVLYSFAENYGLSVVDRWESEDEVGLVVTKEQA